MVERIERVPGGLRLSFSDGDRLRARRVIVATGLDTFARRPEEFRNLPAELVSHTSDHSDLGRFAGRRVAVIGSGQSAIESAALLAEGGAVVEVVARAPFVRWLAYGRGDRLPGLVRSLVYPPTDVGPPALNWMVAVPELFRLLPERLQQRVAYRCIRPAAASWLRSRVHDVRFTIGSQVVEAIAAGAGLRLQLSDGGVRLADHALLATGYQVDVTRLTFLDGEVVAALDVKNGAPRLSRGFESSVPGLHFVGAAAAGTFGPIMRFVVGTMYASRAVRQRVLEERPPSVAQTMRAYARRRERVDATAT
jgi:FAD-dependent urate hydroxylase